MRIVLVLLLFLIAFNASAESIKVGTVGDPPYLIRNNNGVKGFSISLWNIIAERLKLETQFEHFDSLEQALKALNSHRVDLLVGPIAVSPELDASYAFTQSYHRVRLGSATLKKSLSYWQHVQNMAGENFFRYLFVLVLLFIAMAFLIWIFERKINNAQFNPEPKHGILEGFWFAISTVTTNGYADKIPISWKGRILTTAWIIMGAIIYSSITASLTTFFTESASKQHLIGHSLNGKNILVPDQETADLIMEKFHAYPYLFATLNDAFLQLQNGKTHSIITSKSEMRYYLQSHPDIDAVLLNTALEGELYAFLFNNFNDKYYRRVNSEMIRVINDNSMDKIKAKWLD